MLDEKRINEIKGRVQNFIKEKIIEKQKEEKFVNFFLTIPKDAVNSSFAPLVSRESQNTLGKY